MAKAGLELAPPEAELGISSVCPLRSPALLCLSDLQVASFWSPSCVVCPDQGASTVSRALGRLLSTSHQAAEPGALKGLGD